MSNTNSSVLPFQKGHTLALPCTKCHHHLPFSIFELDKSNGLLTCPHCKQTFLFNDPKLLQQLRKFEALCLHIKDAEEILGNTNVGVDVGPHHVKIPYKLLMTRFNSTLNLQLGQEQVTISFRLESQQIP